MDGLTSLGALGSAGATSSAVLPDRSAVAPAAHKNASETPAAPTADAVTVDYAPGSSPSVQHANFENLPLAVRYAPASVPRDLERASKFDRSA
jgi:hypothetical protein